MKSMIKIYMAAWACVVVAGCATSKANVLPIEPSPSASVEVRELILKSNSGDTKAQVSLGERYLDGQGVVESCVKAKLLFQDAISKGEPDGYIGLGSMYLEESGCNSADGGKTIGYVKKAAENGSVRGALLLSSWNRYGGEHVSPVRKPNLHEAFKWGMVAAKAGDALGALLVGEYFLNGVGTKSDREKAVYWLKLSAERGNEKAVEKLGQIESIGSGKVENPLSQAPLGVELGVTTLKDIASKYGPVNIFHEGDAGSSEDRVCLTVDGVTVLFVSHKEMAPKDGQITSVRLYFEYHPTAKAIDNCRVAKVDPQRLSGGYGLRLGLTKAQVEKKLGSTLVESKETKGQWDHVVWTKVPFKKTGPYYSKWVGRKDDCFGGSEPFYDLAQGFSFKFEDGVVTIIEFIRSESVC